MVNNNEDLKVLNAIMSRQNQKQLAYNTSSFAILKITPCKKLPEKRHQYSALNKQQHLLERTQIQQPKNFVLDSLSQSKSRLRNYNALYDRHLSQYFSKDNNLKKLVQTGMIKKNGELGENAKTIAIAQQQDDYDEYSKKRFTQYINSNELLEGSVPRRYKRSKKDPLTQSLALSNSKQTLHYSDSQSQIFNSVYKNHRQNDTTLPRIKDPYTSIDLSVTIKSNSNTPEAKHKQEYQTTSNMISHKILGNLPKIDLKDKFIQYAYIKPPKGSTPYLQTIMNPLMSSKANLFSNNNINVNCSRSSLAYEGGLVPKALYQSTSVISLKNSQDVENYYQQEEKHQQQQHSSKAMYDQKDNTTYQNSIKRIKLADINSSPYRNTNDITDKYSFKYKQIRSRYNSNNQAARKNLYKETILSEPLKGIKVNRYENEIIKT